MTNYQRWHHSAWSADPLNHQLQKQNLPRWFHISLFRYCLEIHTDLFFHLQFLTKEKLNLFDYYYIQKILNLKHFPWAKDIFCLYGKWEYFLYIVVSNTIQTIYEVWVCSLSLKLYDFTIGVWTSKSTLFHVRILLNIFCRSLKIPKLSSN